MPLFELAPQGARECPAAHALGGGGLGELLVPLANSGVTCRANKSRSSSGGGKSRLVAPFGQTVSVRLKAMPASVQCADSLSAAAAEDLECRRTNLKESRGVEERETRDEQGNRLPARYTASVDIARRDGSDVDSVRQSLQAVAVSDIRPEEPRQVAGESVITQVTSRDATQTIQRPLSVPGSDRSSPSSTPVHQGAGNAWRRKVRSLLCCLVPGDNYFGVSTEPALHFPFAGRKEGDIVLPDKLDKDRGKKTLVLDLDETLVHSCFKPVPNPDYIIPVEIEGQIIDVYVVKRPWCDHFLEAVAPHFEVVVFTASLGKYANPLLDLMDPRNLVRHRLFRESCVIHQGNYVKDLSVMGRPLGDLILVDNSPHSYSLQLSNAVPIGEKSSPLQHHQHQQDNKQSPWLHPSH